MVEIKKAVRRALPLQVAFFGPSGSGKTFSALRFAAGLSSNGKVVIVDTERGRASLYADNKKILADLPNGYDVIELDQPYHPSKFIEAIDACENAGYSLCIIDSGSDSWDGPGGCTDIAERDKGWANAKLANKRMMNRAALSNMHIIWLLKAHEKTKIIDKRKSASGKQEYIDMGIQPIWEKNNFYPMLLAFSVDPETHNSRVTKCHDDLWQMFPEPKLIGRDDGLMVRKWNESGTAMGEHDQMRKRARAAAEDGTKSYAAFFNSLTAGQKQYLKSTDHEENKRIANAADKDVAIPTFGTAEQPVEWPDNFEGAELIWNGKRLRYNDDEGGYREVA